MKDILLGVVAILAFALYLASAAALIACGIAGYVVTIQAGNWLLLIAEAILPPLATIHGLGHFIGFWL